MVLSKVRRGYILAATLIGLALLTPLHLQAQSSGFTQEILREVRAFCLFDKEGVTSLVGEGDAGDIDEPKRPFVHLHNAHLLMDSAMFDQAYLQTVQGIQNTRGESLQYLHLLQARIQISKGLYREATESYQAYLRVKTDISSALTNTVESSLGTLYLLLKDYTAALALFKKGLDKADPLTGKQYTKDIYHNLGLTYLHLKQLDSAETYLNKSIALEKQSGDTAGLAISYMDIANLYYEQYLDDKAIALFELGLATARLSNSPEALLSANKNMAVVEENRKNYAKALAYRKVYERLNDSLWNRDRVWELAEQEKQFELSLQQSRIQLLEEQEKAQKATITARNWQRNSLLITSLALLMLISLLLWVNRFLKRKNGLISAQKQQLETLDQLKNQLYSIVAHDLRSPMLALQRSNQKVATALEATTANEATREAIAENMMTTQRTYRLLDNLLHWSLDQSQQWSMQPEIHPVAILAEQVLYDYEPAIQQKEIELVLELPPRHLAFFDINSLKIVLRNLIDNALKHTPQKGRLQIQSAAEAPWLRLTVTDNGSGIDPDRLKTLFSLSRDKVGRDADGRMGTGLGLLLCQSLMEKNGGNFSIESTPGEGTSATMFIPLKNPAHG